jgi:hypothetical protein
MDSNTLSIVLVLLVGVTAGQVRSPDSDPYPFVQYPVNDAFQGTPVAPKLTSARQREFRSVLRSGAQQGPNFAGHYTVVIWGCGASCAQFAIVDAVTGRVYDPPFDGMTGDDGSGLLKGYGLHFRLSSSLLVAVGCPQEKDCATRFYEWSGDRLVLLKSEPAGRLPDVPAAGPPIMTVKP